MTTLLKFVHLATIAIWSGGLLVLPFLFLQRRHLAAGVDLDRLHRITRFVIVGMASPAAVIAIGTGTALIFTQATFREWFTVKMVLVGGMVMLHVMAGLVAMRLFVPDGRFGARGFTLLGSGSLLFIVAIIWVVLAKPEIDSTQFAETLFQPGGLAEWFDQAFGDTSTPTP